MCMLAHWLEVLRNLCDVTVAMPLTSGSLCIYLCYQWCAKRLSCHLWSSQHICWELSLKPDSCGFFVRTHEKYLLFSWCDRANPVQIGRFQTKIRHSATSSWKLHRERSAVKRWKWVKMWWSWRNLKKCCTIMDRACWGGWAPHSSEISQSIEKMWTWQQDYDWSRRNNSLKGPFHVVGGEKGEGWWLQEMQFPTQSSKDTDRFTKQFSWFA